MGLALGLVGLPNAGKSTLFNALTRGSAAVAPYPFTTIDPNLGQVVVPDERLAAVAGVIRPRRVVPATISVIDIAGLTAGAARGEGLGNRFLAHIREVDAVVHVVRCFAGADVPRAEGELNPVRDAELVETELALADLEVVQRAVERARTRAKAGDAAAREHAAKLQDVAEALGRGVPLRRVHTDNTITSIAGDLRLLTAKPLLFIANVDEASLPDGGPLAETLCRLAEQQGAGCIALAARLEADLQDLPAEDARAYLGAVGLEESALPRLARASFALLGLVSFFTILSHEVRAWPVPRGTAAQDAAGRIHTDMAAGFIRAEVIRWDALVAAGSVQEARDRGAVRIEGRDYPVADGDVITFRFAA
ncbi:MAG TPA: redox-regulated ATPase YchF [bacterium]|nr:redox-regulated ATPase YchF [bacterium]